MKSRPEIALMFRATALAARAIAGLAHDPTLFRDADALAIAAARDFPGHLVTEALAAFREAALIWPDGPPRAHAGRVLRDAVLAAARPAPVGLERADING